MVSRILYFAQSYVSLSVYLMIATIIFEVFAFDICELSHRSFFTFAVIAFIIIRITNDLAGVIVTYVTRKILQRKKK